MDTNNTDKGSIAICFVHEALECVRQRGLDPQPLLQQAGIAPQLLAAPNARVASRHFGALWHGIAQTLDDEFFGMDSRRMKTGSFTLLCHAVVHSETLEQALRRALRFLRLVLDDLCGELQREGELAHIILHTTADAGTATGHAGATPRAFAYGTYLIILHGLACWLVARRIPLLRADFSCSEPAYSAEWKVLFSQDLRFGQPVCRISFAASYLDRPNLQNVRSMKEFLRGAPANFLVKYKNSASLSATIRRRLRAWAPAAWPDFDTLALQLHSSPATLRRRLDEEGASYRSILDDLRRDLAIGLLSDTRLTMADIACELGFSETSAFHRAFKKWTGAPPGRYRYGTLSQVNRLAPALVPSTLFPIE